MASNSEFWAKYQRPEWQKKSAAIRERAGYECEWCGDNESQLDVHHSYYEKDNDPWDYPDDSLHCLCKKCHKEQQDLKKEINRQYGRLNLSDMRVVLGFLQGLEMESWPMVETMLVDPEHAAGIGAVYGIDDTSVIWSHDKHKVNGYTLAEISGPVFERKRDVRQPFDEKSCASIERSRLNRARKSVLSEFAAAAMQGIDPWNCAATG